MYDSSVVKFMYGSSVVEFMYDSSVVKSMYDSSICISRKKLNPVILTPNKKIKMKYV